MGADATITSSDGDKIAGYLDFYPIGKGYQNVLLCSSFLGSWDARSGQMAIRTDPDPRVVAANGGKLDGIRTMILAGTIGGSTWSGKVQFVPAFRTFSLTRGRAPVLRKPHCTVAAADLNNRTARREALVAERSRILADMAADAAAYQALMRRVDRLSEDCEQRAEDAAKMKIIAHGLEQQMFRFLSKTVSRAYRVVDWAVNLYNSRNEPLDPTAQILGDKFFCLAGAYEEKVALIQRRIAFEKRISEIEGELDLLD